MFSVIKRTRRTVTVASVYSMATARSADPDCCRARCRAVTSNVRSIYSWHFAAPKSHDPALSRRGSSADPAFGGCSARRGGRRARNDAHRVEQQGRAAGAAATSLSLGEGRGEGVSPRRTICGPHPYPLPGEEGIGRRPAYSSCPVLWAPSVESPTVPNEARQPLARARPELCAGPAAGGACWRAPDIPRSDLPRAASGTRDPSAQARTRAAGLGSADLRRPIRELSGAVCTRCKEIS